MFKLLGHVNAIKPNLVRLAHLVEEQNIRRYGRVGSKNSLRQADNHMQIELGVVGKLKVNSCRSKQNKIEKTDS